MKTIIFVLLLTIALSACAPGAISAPAAKPILPAATLAPNATLIQAPAPTAVTPAVAPASADTAILPTKPGLAPWSLVAVGDSLPYNSPDDCHGCTSFVDRYAAAIEKATGHPVTVQNLSQHNGLQTDGLLEELKTDVKRREALANADIIIVSIANNDHPLAGYDACHGFTGDSIDWSKFTPTCTAAAAENFRPKLESVFAQIVALRAGKPTIFRTINGYNDWLGGTDTATGKDTPPEATNPTRALFDAWSAMICKAAQSNGFTCADTYHAFNGPDGLKPIAGDLTASKMNSHPSDKGNEVIAQVLADLGYAPLVAPGSTTVLPDAETSPAKPATAAALTPQQVAAELDKTLQDLTSANQFSGSVLVAQNGQVILSKGYGLADREKKTTINAQTKFRIGMMTKQFTAMAIMLLQERGKLNVQDKICTYLTDCPEAWKVITIHQLLTQTAGIPDNSDAFITQDITSSALLEQMIAEVKKLPLDFQPGERYSNNNMSYILLGKIIEAASGGSYEAFLQKNIFEPLQMSNTGYDPNRTDVAIGYADQASVADPTNLWVMFSAAGLYSTVEDLYRYDQALYTDQLLPEKALDTMFTSYVPSERDSFGYGYGGYVALGKPSMVKIPSSGNGFDNTFRRYLDDKVTIIELSNEQDYDNVTFVNWIQKALLGK